MMFAALEEFISVHRPCGRFEHDLGEPTAEGYSLEVTCACGEVFERWISPELAAEDLLRSRLLTTEN